MGATLMYSQRFFESPTVFAYIVVMLTVGLVIDAAMLKNPGLGAGRQGQLAADKRLSRRLSRWPSRNRFETIGLHRWLALTGQDQECPTTHPRQVARQLVRAHHRGGRNPMLGLVTSLTAFAWNALLDD